MALNVMFVLKHLIIITMADLPSIINYNNYLKVIDCEPLNVNPPPANCANEITIECNISGGSSSKTIEYSISSTSSSSAMVDYNSEENTINIIINDSGANSGSPFNGALSYNPGENDNVNVDAKKNGERVGKQKHKINYNTE